MSLVNSHQLLVKYTVPSTGASDLVDASHLANVRQLRSQLSVLLGFPVALLRLIVPSGPSVQAEDSEGPVRPALFDSNPLRGLPCVTRAGTLVLSVAVYAQGPAGSTGTAATVSAPPSPREIHPVRKRFSSAGARSDHLADCEDSTMTAPALASSAAAAALLQGLRIDMQYLPQARVLLGVVSSLGSAASTVHTRVLTSRDKVATLLRVCSGGPEAIEAVGPALRAMAALLHRPSGGAGGADSPGRVVSCVRAAESAAARPRAAGPVHSSSQVSQALLSTGSMLADLSGSGLGGGLGTTHLGAGSLGTSGRAPVSLGALCTPVSPPPPRNRTAQSVTAESAAPSRAPQKTSAKPSRDAHPRAGVPKGVPAGSRDRHHSKLGHCGLFENPPIVGGVNSAVGTVERVPKTQNRAVSARANQSPDIAAPVAPEEIQRNAAPSPTPQSPRHSTAYVPPLAGYGFSRPFVYRAALPAFPRAAGSTDSEAVSTSLRGGGLMSPPMRSPASRFRPATAGGQDASSPPWPHIARVLEECGFAVLCGASATTIQAIWGPEALRSVLSTLKSRRTGAVQHVAAVAMCTLSKPLPEDDTLDEVPKLPRLVTLSGRRKCGKTYVLAQTIRKLGGAQRLTRPVFLLQCKVDEPSMKTEILRTFSFDPDLLATFILRKESDVILSPGGQPELLHWNSGLLQHFCWLVDCGCVVVLDGWSSITSAPMRLFDQLEGALSRGAPTSAAYTTTLLKNWLESPPSPSGGSLVLMGSAPESGYSFHTGLVSKFKQYVSSSTKDIGSLWNQAIQSSSLFPVHLAVPPLDAACTVRLLCYLGMNDAGCILKTITTLGRTIGPYCGAFSAGTFTAILSAIHQGLSPDSVLISFLNSILPSRGSLSSGYYPDLNNTSNAVLESFCRDATLSTHGIPEKSSRAVVLQTVLQPHGYVYCVGTGSGAVHDRKGSKSCLTPFAYVIRDFHPLIIASHSIAASGATSLSWSALLTDLFPCLFGSSSYAFLTPNAVVWPSWAVQLITCRSDLPPTLAGPRPEYLKIARSSVDGVDLIVEDPSTQTVVWVFAELAASSLSPTTAVAHIVQYFAAYRWLAPRHTWSHVVMLATPTISRALQPDDPLSTESLQETIGAVNKCLTNAAGLGRFLSAPLRAASRSFIPVRSGSGTDSSGAAKPRFSSCVEEDPSALDIPSLTHSYNFADPLVISEVCVLDMMYPALLNSCRTGA